MSGLVNRPGLQRMAPSGERFPIDVVFVVDGTESMSVFVDSVKQRIGQLDADIAYRLRGTNRVLDSMRVRLIVFRDLFEDSSSAFDMTKFLELPTQSDELTKAIAGIEAFGGGDPSESGLEALFLAMRSAWRSEPQDIKRRHIIMLFTDQDAHDFGAAIPESLAQLPHPRTMTELKKLWGPRTQGGLMNVRARRMILFAPEFIETEGSKVSTHWAQIAEEWEQVAMTPLPEGGIDDLTWQAVIDAIISTI